MLWAPEKCDKKWESNGLEMQRKCYARMLAYGVCKGEQSPPERATGDNESLGEQDLDRVGLERIGSRRGSEERKSNGRNCWYLRQSLLGGAAR